MVSFDVETDRTFLESLDDLGQDVVDAVFNELFNVAAHLSWPDFCTAYQWREHVRQSIDTYPGAVPYYRFVIALPEGVGRGAVDIFALSYEDSLVLCAVAQ